MDTEDISENSMDNEYIKFMTLEQISAKREDKINSIKNIEKQTLFRNMLKNIQFSKNFIHEAFENLTCENLLKLYSILFNNKNCGTNFSKLNLKRKGS